MRTVEGIRGVTRTLATVSAAKLSRTRRRAAGLREYAAAMRALLHRQQAYLTGLSAEQAALVSPFFAERIPCRSVTLLHITGDRGMCGNYNQVANRMSAEFISRRAAAGQTVALIAKGAKGERYLSRKTSASVVHAEPWPRAGVTEEDVGRLYQLIVSRFLDGEADEVWCLYTRFYSPLKRVPRLVRLLPVAAERLADATAGAGLTKRADAEVPAVVPVDRWSYEPSFSALVDELVSIFVRLQVEDVLLESFASEQGARMVTMEEATERADKSLHEMRMRYNRLRRELITTDLIGVLFASQVTAEEKQRESFGASGEAAGSGAS